MMREGTFAASEGGLRYKLGPLYEVVGAALDDPAQDELPTDPADARVVDQEFERYLVDLETFMVERHRRIFRERERERRFPEMSNFGCLPGKAGGIPRHIGPVLCDYTDSRVLRDDKAESLAVRIAIPEH